MKTYFVEHLTLRSWFCAILPHLIGDKLHKRPAVEQCYVLETSAVALAVARPWAWLLRIQLERFDYRLIDVKDKSGVLIGFRITSRDLIDVKRLITQEALFSQISESDPSSRRLSAYVAKKLGIVEYIDPSTVHRALLLIQVCLWKCRQLKQRDLHPHVFLGRRVFMHHVIDYAQRNNVTVVPVSPPIRLLPLIQGSLRPSGIAFLRWLRNLWFERRLKLKRMRRLTDQPRLATDHQGHLNLTDPASFSDLTFWQESSLLGDDVLMTFGIPKDPIDDKGLTALNEHGIHAVAVHPKAATTRAVPFFMHKPDLSRRLHRPSVQRANARLDSQWVESQIEGYYVERDYWDDLFSTLNIRLYVTWYRYDEKHCAIADAMQNLGGITAVYQRGFQPDSSSEITVNTDIVFSYSPANALVESSSGSEISYHVAVGYIGDHRFPLHRDRARSIRHSLAQHGAQFVAAFFDENSHDNEKLLLGHSVTRENYEFLLKKVLDNPWLGLVIKPKAPHTLSGRLGPVAELLNAAEATGRCTIIREGSVRSATPPSLAALASDVAVHGHLTAATAGLEAALAGIPTVLMDREGCSNSPLYRLDRGRVVFQEWSDLWGSLCEYRNNHIEGFGDWGRLLDEFDPFRDGRAAERMGTYIQWLIQGLKADQDRETIMANAAERYAAIWGEDKITSVNVNRPSFQLS